MYKKINSFNRNIFIPIKWNFVVIVSSCFWSVNNGAISNRFVPRNRLFHFLQTNLCLIRKKKKKEKKRKIVKRKWISSIVIRRDFSYANKVPNNRKIGHLTLFTILCQRVDKVSYEFLFFTVPFYRTITKVITTKSRCNLQYVVAS